MIKTNEKKREHLFWTAMPSFSGLGLALPRPEEHIHVRRPVQQCGVVWGQFADVRDNPKRRKNVDKDL